MCASCFSTMNVKSVYMISLLLVSSNTIKGLTTTAATTAWQPFTYPYGFWTGTFGQFDICPTKPLEVSSTSSTINLSSSNYFTCDIKLQANTQNSAVQIHVLAGTVRPATVPSYFRNSYTSGTCVLLTKDGQTFSPSQSSCDQNCELLQIPNWSNIVVTPSSSQIKNRVHFHYNTCTQFINATSPSQKAATDAYGTYTSKPNMNKQAKGMLNPPTPLQPGQIDANDENIVLPIVMGSVIGLLVIGLIVALVFLRKTAADRKRLRKELQDIDKEWEVISNPGTEPSATQKNNVTQQTLPEVGVYETPIPLQNYGYMDLE